MLFRVKFECSRKEELERGTFRLVLIKGWSPEVLVKTVSRELFSLSELLGIQAKLVPSACLWFYLVPYGSEGGGKSERTEFVYMAWFGVVYLFCVRR